MAEVRGRYIQMAYALMAAYPAGQKSAQEVVLAATGKEVKALEPEGWYPAALFGEVMDQYAAHSINGIEALVTLGRRIYPTLKKEGALPPHLTQPIDFLKFENEGYLAASRGPEVVPRRFLSVKDREVVVQAKGPGYNEKLFEGVYLGILEMLGLSGRVQAEADSVFRIRW